MHPARLARALAAAPRSPAERRQLEELRRFARRQPSGDVSMLRARLLVYALQREHVLLLSRYHLDTWKSVYRQTAEGKCKYDEERRELAARLRTLASVIKQLKRVVYDK